MYKGTPNKWIGTSTRSRVSRDEQTVIKSSEEEKDSKCMRRS